MMRYFWVSLKTSQGWLCPWGSVRDFKETASCNIWKPVCTEHYAVPQIIVLPWQCCEYSGVYCFKGGTAFLFGDDCWITGNIQSWSNTSSEECWQLTGADQLTNGADIQYPVFTCDNMLMIKVPGDSCGFPWSDDTRVHMWWRVLASTCSQGGLNQSLQSTER